MITDIQWAIVKAQAGDPEALEGVLTEASRIAAPVVRRIAAGSADDVLQDVLWAIARKLRWLDDPAAFRPWIYRIATRAAVKHVTRERRVWPFGSHEDPESIPEPAPVMPEAPRAQEIEALLAQATPRSRAVIVLHYIEEMSLDEVAAVLGLPLGTVKSRLAYGLRAMRRAALENER